MKHYLTTTATALMLGTAAFAQDTATSTMGIGDVTIDSEMLLASDLMGMRIYTPAEGTASMETPNVFSIDDGWNDIGEINNLVVAADGTVEAVIAGVGGFLGIGEKDVAVSMNELKFMNDENNDRYIVVEASEESLRSAPAFDIDMGAAHADMNVEATATGENAEMADADATMEHAESADMAAADATMENAESTNLAEAEATAESTTSTDLVASDQVAPAGMENAYEPEGYAEVDTAGLTAEELTGTAVMGLDNDKLGEIGDLVIADSGEITDVIIDFGGFLGIGEKQVAVRMDDMQFLANQDRTDIRVVLNATREQLEEMPEYDG